MTTILTKTHDSATCDSANGQPCEFCTAAIDYETRQKIERVHQMMSEDCDCDIHRLSQTERTNLIEAAIDATNAEACDNSGYLLTTFDDDWELAPLSMTRTTEFQVAEYFWRLGHKQGLREGLLRANSDLRQLLQDRE